MVTTGSAGKVRYECRAHLVMVFGIMVLAGCHRAGFTSLSGEFLDARVTVLNAVSFSGCFHVLHPDSGPDLLPVSFTGEPVDWVQEGIYQVRYRPEPVSVYSCTAEGVPVQIVHAKAIDTDPPPGTGGIRPEVPDCVQAIDPYQVPWMTQIMEQTDPRLVVRYSLDGRTVYGFLGNDHHEQLPFYLFDCRGNRLCVQIDEATSCTLRNRLQDDYTILIRNH